MSDSGQSIGEAAGEVVKDIGKSFSSAISEAAATTFGSPQKSSTQQPQQTSQKGMTPQEFAEYQRNKQIIINSTNQEAMKTKQANVQRIQQQTQGVEQTAQTSGSAASPATTNAIRQDIAETMPELKAGRRGG